MRRFFVPVLVVVSVCGLVFIARFFFALCQEPKSSRSTHVWFIRARMHRIISEKRHDSAQKRAA